MRIFASICALAMLAGCGNAVVSRTALFTPADAHGQAQLRPGVWGLSDSSKLPTCKVDMAKPVETWDSCALGMVVKPGELWGANSGQPLTMQERIVLARGAPAVLQIMNLDKNEAGPPYDYAGVRPLKFDAQGRIVELKLWEAMCGPSPPDDPNGQKNEVTHALLSGLVADQNHYNCLARTQGPVRVSVARSETWSHQNGGGIANFRWFRDGEH